MTLLAQISDLHITRPGELLGGRIDTAPFLERAVRRLAALVPRPDAVLATGDLVDRGTVEEYEALRALLAPLELPIYLMVGNHDNRDALRAVFGDAPYLRTTGEFIQYTFDLPGLRVIALDSHDPATRTGGGRLCRARRAWLAAQLEASTDHRVVLAIHHPPFVTGVPFMDAIHLDHEDAAALAAIVGRHHNVERILCGHIHRSIHARFAGTIASTAPSVAHQVELTFDPAAPAAFTLEPPALALHLTTPAGLVSHQLYIDRFDGPHAF